MTDIKIAYYRICIGSCALVRPFKLLVRLSLAKIVSSVGTAEDEWLS